MKDWPELLAFGSLSPWGSDSLKLDIIGSVASGKTTLAKEISERYEIPYYEKDNIVWERTACGDKKRSPQERDRIFQTIIAEDSWIVEGSPRNCLQESFLLCDYIIFLDAGTRTRLFRVFRRWIRQKLGKEKFNSKPTLNFLYLNIKWVFEFNHQRQEILSTLSIYGNKFKVFRHSEDVLNFIEKLEF